MAHYKLGIYGEPATGKSVFALQFPKPFFITTDSNYEFLYDFGAKEEDHKQVESWAEFKKFIKEFDFTPYETIVLDVIEDLYMWAETEYCAKNRIEDLSDVGYGKGYKIVRTDFVNEIFKLIAKEKNVIIISHQDETLGKTARGGEYTSYTPSKTISDWCWTKINGRLRYFFRAHLEDVNDGDKITTKRMLSITPKPHELQINRGKNIDALPADIELDFKTFCDTLDVHFDNKPVATPKVATPKVAAKVATPKVAVKAAAPKVEAPKPVETPDVIEDEELPFDTAGIDLKPEAPKVEEKPKVEAPKPAASAPKAETPAEKLVRIRAMLEKNKANK